MLLLMGLCNPPLIKWLCVGQSGRGDKASRSVVSISFNLRYIFVFAIADVPVYFVFEDKLCIFEFCTLSMLRKGKLARNLLAEAKTLGANCIVVACPLCHMMLSISSLFEFHNRNFLMLF